MPPSPPAPDSPDLEPPPGSFLREGSGLEFDRVSFFTDAVYAIAMTLLVVELRVPAGLDAPGALQEALWEERIGILGFFIGFVLLGRYWLAHHQFFASLRSIDGRLISLNLVYLAFVAFMPFPVALISRYEDNPLSFYLFAGCMAIISLLEVVMFLHAARRGHTRFRATPPVIRFGLVASGTPVLVMLASFALAVLDTTYALLSWLILIPFGTYMHRRAPDAVRGLSGG
jgi:uncharacterized membrane protein